MNTEYDGLKYWRDAYSKKYGDPKPCPRCAHVVHFHTGFFHSHGMFNPGAEHWYRFWCPRANNFDPQFTGCGFQMEFSQPHYDVDDLIKAWNIRPFSDIAEWHCNIRRFGERAKDLKYPEVWSPQEDNTRQSFMNGNA